MSYPDRKYIGSSDYLDLKDRIKTLTEVMDELSDKQDASRRLRYTEVDVEMERTNGNLQPDELLITQHIIDSNIRKEQSSYIQYVAQSPRAVVLQDQQSPSNDCSLLERDVTNRLRFDSWQLPMFATIDAFQANGYSVVEVVQDLTQPGELAFEAISMGDFGFIMDTRDINSVEMCARSYYFTKTQLVDLCDPNKTIVPFTKSEVDKVIDSESAISSAPSMIDSKEKSLYKIYKVMFRVKGVVYVAWASYERANDWLRVPKPLSLGRRKIVLDQMQQPVVNTMTGLPESTEQYEKDYPYIIFPYLISEDNNISHLKGRVYLDQDTQEATTSLISSFCTAHRRASGLYFSKDVSDPNDDILLQKNVFFRQGALINAKVSQFQLTPPPAEMISAIQMLVSANQQETSQINWAVNNRKDSRKTAREVEASVQSQQQLSTVQVVLFSTALRQLYKKMFEIIQSRVIAGLIKVDQTVLPLYARKYILKPSGDTDVIERQQRIQAMMNSWGVMQNTPANVAFLSDLLTLLFPDYAPKYIQIFQQQQAQQQSQQAQQMQQMMGVAKQIGDSITQLSKKPEMFSETGRVHVLPIIENMADQYQQLVQQTTRNGNGGQ